jgi:hypothetical protein
MSEPPPSGETPLAGPKAVPPIAVCELDASGAGGFKRLLGRKSGGRISFGYKEIVFESPEHLRAPLTVAPGAILAASVDPGPAEAKDAIGRFPILRRLSGTAVIPQREGIEGWLWTSTGGSAYELIGDEDMAPNVALVFLQPLGGEVVTEAFEPDHLEELAKRSPLGNPAIFGLLARVARVEDARKALEKLDAVKPITDREVPPTMRRHLPTDKPADPKLHLGGGESSRAQTSVPPPGMS